MTFRAIDPAITKIYYAEEADRPISTVNIPDGSLVIFTDSGLEDSFDSVANAWFNREQITQSSNGKTAVLVIQADIPAKAETWYVQIDGDVGTNDNDLIYESGDISMYNTHVIENMSAGAGSCDVHVSLDGTNYVGSAASVELIDDVTTGGGIKVITIPQNKTGILIGKFNKIKVLQDGATAADARITHSVS